MTGIVPGDPGSISLAGAHARGAAGALRSAAEEVATAYLDIGLGWPGRASVGHRRGADDLVTASREVAETLEEVAGVLQDHATDLAELRARARVLDGRLAAAGAMVRDGVVRRRPGVRGVVGAAPPDDDLVALQAEVDLVRTLLDRRRAFVLDRLRASTDALSGLSHSLRAR